MAGSVRHNIPQARQDLTDARTKGLMQVFRSVAASFNLHTTARARERMVDLGPDGVRPSGEARLGIRTGRLLRSLTAAFSALSGGMMREGYVKIETSPDYSRARIEKASLVPYYAIHEEGGTITITDKMRRFFWARHKATGEDRWKWMALSGGPIRIPARPTLGPAAQEATPLVLKEAEKDLAALFTRLGRAR